MRRDRRIRIIACHDRETREGKKWRPRVQRCWFHVHHLINSPLSTMIPTYHIRRIRRRTPLQFENKKIEGRQTELFHANPWEEQWVHCSSPDLTHFSIENLVGVFDASSITSSPDKDYSEMQRQGQRILLPSHLTWEEGRHMKHTFQGKRDHFLTPLLSIHCLTVLLENKRKEFWSVLVLYYHGFVSGTVSPVVCRRCTFSFFIWLLNMVIAINTPGRLVKLFERESRWEEMERMYLKEKKKEIPSIGFWWTSNVFSLPFHSLMLFAYLASSNSRLFRLFFVFYPSKMMMVKPRV